MTLSYRCRGLVSPATVPRQGVWELQEARLWPLTIAPPMHGTMFKNIELIYLDVINWQRRCRHEGAFPEKSRMFGKIIH
jgi:hypothetical protein